jgi:hypothetical protein
VVDITFIDEFIKDVVGPIITSEKEIEDSKIRSKVRGFKDRKSAEYLQWYNQQSEVVKRTIDEYTKKLKDGGNTVVKGFVEKQVTPTPQNTNQQTPIVTPQNTNQTPSGKKDWD